MNVENILELQTTNYDYETIIKKRMIELKEGLNKDIEFNKNQIISSIFLFDEESFDKITQNQNKNDFLKYLPKKISFDERIKHTYYDYENYGFNIINLVNLNINFLDKILKFIEKYTFFDFFYEHLYIFFLQSYIDSYDKITLKYNEFYYELFEYVLTFMNNNQIKFNTNYYCIYSEKIEKYNIYENFSLNILFLLKTNKPNILDMFYLENNKNNKLIPYLNIYMNPVRIHQSFYYKNKYSNLYDEQFLFQKDEWYYLIEKYPIIFYHHEVIQYLLYDLENAFNNILKTGIENKNYIDYLLNKLVFINNLLPNVFNSDDYSYILYHIAVHNIIKYKIFNILPSFERPVVYFEKHFDSVYFMKNTNESYLMKILLHSDTNGLIELVYYVFDNIHNNSFLKNYINKEKEEEDYIICLRHKIDFIKLCTSIIFNRLNPKDNNQYIYNYSKKDELNKIIKIDNENLNLFTNKLLTLYSHSIIKYYEDEFLIYFFENVLQLKYSSLICFLSEYIKSERILDISFISNILNKSLTKIPFHLELLLLNNI
jgi:hypothetical protein